MPLYNNVGLAKGAKGTGTSGYVLKNNATKFKPAKSSSSSSTPSTPSAISSLQASTNHSQTRRNLLRECVYVPLAEYEKELVENSTAEDEKLLLIAIKKRELLSEFEVLMEHHQRREEIERQDGDEKENYRKRRSSER
ncbi:hypothetical protein RCL1_002447 [Eukaryota sp. TZLM3-RCL]